jgi:phage shock protein C
MERRLYRSRDEKMIGGVCGGLAEYFNVDPTLVRLIWVIITLIGGAGVLLYIVLWLIMPISPPPPPAAA